MKLLFTVMAVCGVLAAQGQDSSIYEVHHYKAGVYKNFDEFQHNAPSQTSKLVVKDKTNASQIYLLSPRNELSVVDSSGQQHKLKKFWGYSDGTAVYIHDDGLNKLDEIGYYCLYRIKVLSQPAIPNRSTEGIVFQNTPPALIDKRVLDITTGTVYDLSYYNMRKFLLAKDKELLAEFNEDPQNKQRLAYYIEKFNRRNMPPNL
jgi:hypothetical protein